MTITYLVGDVFEQLTKIPDASVDMIGSSPPFLLVRSYLPPDHPDKDKEIGAETNPGAFVQTLLDLTNALGQKLAPHGSLVIELGDTYSGSGGGGGDYLPGGMREGQQQFSGSAAAGMRESNAAHWRAKNPRRDREQDTAEGVLPPLSRPGAAGRDELPGWPMAKSLALIPQAYALSLAYGRNVLLAGVTPQQMLDFIDLLVADGIPAAEAIEMARTWLPQVEKRQPAEFDRWRVRNEIVWHRPNPGVGALADKVRPSTSYICVATRDINRWYDLTAVRSVNPRTAEPVASGAQRSKGELLENNPAGAPPLDCWFDEHDTWTVTTQPSKLAHYAMWPPKLAERLILMMCPREVCKTCGEPRRRIESKQRVRIADGMIDPPRVPPTRDDSATGTTAIGIRHGTETISSTLGWTHCGCAGRRTTWKKIEIVYEAEGEDGELVIKKRSIRVVDDMGEGTPEQYRPGIVLDPFAGTGTTLCVADIHGRDAIGIDIDERNHRLMPARAAECRRALYGTQPEIPGQLDMFAQEAS